MASLRAFILRNRILAALLVAAALCLKAAVPAGYMISPVAKILTVVVCADASGQTMTRQVAVPVDRQHDTGRQGPRSDSVCAYSALGMFSLPGADAVLLAIALAFVLATGFVPVRAAAHRCPTRLRPPLRGPPLLS